MYNFSNPANDFNLQIKEKSSRVSISHYFNDLNAFVSCYFTAKTGSIPVRFIEGDIRNINDIDKAFQKATVVIHNAAIVDVTSSPDEAKMNRVNIQGNMDRQLFYISFVNYFELFQKLETSFLLKQTSIFFI